MSYDPLRSTLSSDGHEQRHHTPSRWLHSLIVVSLVLTVAAVGAILWFRAPTRQVITQTASHRIPVPLRATQIPENFSFRFSRPHHGSDVPLLASGVLITAENHSLTGWDPHNGKKLWHYQQPSALCTAAAAWGKVFAVYRGPQGCSLTVALNGATGARPQDLHTDSRTSNGSLFPALQLTPTAHAQGSEEDSGSTAHSWGPHLLTVVGPGHIELWHEGLLRSVEYGRTATPLEPHKQPRPECVPRSLAVGDSAFAVLERCKNEKNLRLSFLKTTPKKDTEPEKACADPEPCSAQVEGLSAHSNPQLLAVAGLHALVFAPATSAEPDRLLTLDQLGHVLSYTPLHYPVTHHNVLPWRTHSGLITWWTGTAVVGISPENLHYVFETPGLAGPATQMADKLIAPTSTGIAVLDPVTGVVERDRTLPAPAQPSQQVIYLAVVGSLLLRQQDGEVLVYSPR